MNADDRYLELAVAAAKEAGRIQMFHLGHSHPVEYKGEFNPVTEVDRLCEGAIVKTPELRTQSLGKVSEQVLKMTMRHQSPDIRSRLTVFLEPEQCHETSSREKTV